MARSLGPLWNKDDSINSAQDVEELTWTALQPFLASHGYALRRRWQPGWIPSWRRSGEWASQCEDGLLGVPFLGHIMDAWSIKHNRRVVLKQVRRNAYGDNEIRILRYIAQDPLLSDPTNHSIPLLEVLEPSSSFDFVLIVMPLFLGIEDLKFLSVGDIMEFCHQILEGLVFMHEHNLAHRDCCTANIMVDGEALFPNGRHPLGILPFPGQRGDPRTLRLSDISPKYFFIDFGHSDLFNSVEERIPVFGRRGQYKEAPELQVDEPVDGFKLDIWCVGFLFRFFFTSRYPDTSTILGDLVERMTLELPNDRPTASDAFDDFKRIHKSLGRRQLERRAPRWDETRFERIPALISFHFGNIARRLWFNSAKQATLYQKSLQIPYVLSSFEPETPVAPMS